MALTIDHILFPTDFSNNAERALPFAAETAYRTGARLTLFHAGVNTMDMSPDFVKAKNKEIRDTDRKFNTIIAKLKETDRYKNISIRTILQSGNATTALINQIDEDKPDLLVMGTQGSTGDRNVLYGSVTTSIIQKSKVPVLAVPYGSKFDGFSNIVFATDFKEGDLDTLKETVSWAKLFDSSIDVLHVAEQQSLEEDIKFRGFRELATTQTEYEKMNFHIRYEYDFFPAAAEFILERPASLMVMCKYKKTFWEAFGQRNHSKEMGFYSQIPLLILIGKKNRNYIPSLDEEENSHSL